MQFTQSTCVCPVHCPPEGLQERQQAAATSAAQPLEVITSATSMTLLSTVENPPERFPNDARFALLTIAVHQGFAPKTPQEGLPSCVQGFSRELAPLIVRAINESEWSKEKGRWAIQSLSGGVVVVRGVVDGNRPKAASALPSNLEPLRVESKAEAKQFATDRNVERLKVAIVPREWTIAVENPRFGMRDSNDFGLEMNPRAIELEDQYREQLDAIEAELPETITIESWGLFSEVTETGEWNRRAATDEECRQFRLTIEPPTFDVTGDIREGIANALTDHALAMLHAAINLRNGPSAEATKPAETLELAPAC